MDASDGRTFLPMGLRIGGGYTFDHTADHKLTLAADVLNSRPGYAMKADPEKAKTGQVLGKALQELKSGSGKIKVLVNVK